MVTPAPLRIDLRVPAEPGSVALARHQMEALLERCGPAITENVKLVVSELVTNCVRHAELAASDEVTVVIEAGDDGVRGSVTDAGVGFELVPGDLEPQDGSGFGLLIVERLSRRWGVVNGGDRTTVWFEL